MAKSGKALRKEDGLKLLAIETATEACSAALRVNGDVLCRYRLAPREHAGLILSMVDELLAEAGLRLGELDALAFGRGPGAFTGVRIAAGVIQGLAYGADLPVVPISSLAALAQSAANGHSHILAAIDARMGEVYWGTYGVEGGLVALLGAESVSKPEAVTPATDQTLYGVGTGWRTYKDVLGKRLGPRLAGCDGDRYPDARHILPLAAREFESGRTVPAAQALPVYLRNQVAKAGK